MKTWADRIADLRSIGMTLAEIGDATGMAVSTVGDLATGRSKAPRGEFAVKLHALHRRSAKAIATAALARLDSTA